MANAKLSVLATQFSANAAAIATAVGGGAVTSDMQVLANILKTMSLRVDMALPLLELSPATDAPNQLVIG